MRITCPYINDKKHVNKDWLITMAYARKTEHTTKLLEMRFERQKRVTFSKHNQCFETYS